MSLHGTFFSLHAQILLSNYGDSISGFHVDSWSTLFLVYLLPFPFSTFRYPLSVLFLFLSVSSYGFKVLLSLPHTLHLTFLCRRFFLFHHSASPTARSCPCFLRFPLDLFIFPVFFHFYIFLLIFFFALNSLICFYLNPSLYSFSHFAIFLLLISLIWFNKNFCSAVCYCLFSSLLRYSSPLFLIIQVRFFYILHPSRDVRWRVPIKSMWNTAVGIKKCKQLFSLQVAFTTQKKATHAAKMMSVECVAIFWVVNASSGEKSCLQFSIPTGSGAGEEGGVSHSLKDVVSCSGPFWKLISEFFFITKYNTIVLIFLYLFIGIINYKKNVFLIYFIQFYTGLLSQSRHLQIEVGGWCRRFRHFESSETKKNKKDYFSVCSWLRLKLELNIFINK